MRSGHRKRADFPKQLHTGPASGAAKAGEAMGYAAKNNTGGNRCSGQGQNSAPFSNRKVMSCNHTKPEKRGLKPSTTMFQNVVPRTEGLKKQKERDASTFSRKGEEIKIAERKGG